MALCPARSRRRRFQPAPLIIHWVGVVQIPAQSWLGFSYKSSVIFCEYGGVQYAMAPMDDVVQLIGLVGATFDGQRWQGGVQVARHRTHELRWEEVLRDPLRLILEAIEQIPGSH